MEAARPRRLWALAAWQAIAVLLLPGARAGRAADNPPPTRGPAPAASTTGAEVVATVNGRPVLREEIERFLYLTVGRSLLQDYMDQIIIEEEAKRLGISIPYEAVEREAELEIDRRARLFGQTREKYRVYLESLGRAFGDEIERVRRETLKRLVLDHCIQKTRQVSDDDVRRELERSRAPKKTAAAEADAAAFEDLRRKLRERAVTSEERQAYLEGLRKRVKTEGFPGSAGSRPSPPGTNPSPASKP